MTDDSEDAPASISILDAVICVHFAGANQQHILVKVLKQLDMRILVPGEVHAEVVGKEGKYPGLAQRWRRLTNSGRVTVLPRLMVGDTEQADVLARFAELRGKAAAAALSVSEHRGEFAVMAHALVRQDAGETVIVLIDDGGAQELASDNHLSVVDIQTLLETGHRGKVLGLETIAEVRDVYTALLPFGDGLPKWKSSNLYKALR